MISDSSMAIANPQATTDGGIQAGQAGLGKVGVAAVIYLLLFGVMVWGALQWAQLVPNALTHQTNPSVLNGPHGLAIGIDLMICLAPAALALVLAFTSREDRQQYVARLLACAAMLPVLLLMWGSSQPMPVADVMVWSAVGALVAMHIAVFLLAMWWLARLATRISAQSGAAVVGATLLGQRLQSLVAAGLPVDVSPGEIVGEWRLAMRFAPKVPRSHRVRLMIDESTHTVRVRERLGARGAAPLDADEASLRSIGDHWFDPSRPDAQRVSGIVWQTSMIDAERLAATGLQLEGARVSLLSPVAESLDADGVMMVLAALVTRSGYGWHPELGAC